MPEEISARRYTVLGTRDIWLGYAGRKEKTNSIHKALCRLEAGDEVRLQRRGDLVFITTMDGQEVAALSKRAREACRDRLGRIVAARVIAMVEWRAGDTGEKYRSEAKVDSWEFPIVEVASV